jgi:hypothetical protein
MFCEWIQTLGGARAAVPLSRACLFTPRRLQAVIWQLLHVLLKTAAIVGTIHGRPTAVLGCKDPRLIPRMGAASDKYNRSVC